MILFFLAVYTAFKNLEKNGVKVNTNILETMQKFRRHVQKKQRASEKNKINKAFKCFQICLDKYTAGKISKDNNTEQERFLRQIYNAYRKTWSEKFAPR